MSNYYKNKLKIGSIIGDLKVVSEIFRKNNTWFFTCECSCGKVRDFRSWHLNNHKVKSCGCSNNIGHFKFKGIEDLSLSYFNSFKRCRIKKGIEFSDDVTIKFLWNLFQRQNGRCALSNVEIVLDKKWSGKGSKFHKIIQTASIDRIDNSKGYEIGNVRWVHKDVNFMKGGIEDSTFIYLCKMISDNNKINLEDFDKEKLKGKRLFFK